jgi:hypothetical protein
MERKNDIDYLLDLLYRYIYLEEDKNIKKETMVIDELDINRIKKTIDNTDEKDLNKIVEDILTDVKLYRELDDRIELIRKGKRDALIIIKLYDLKDRLDHIEDNSNKDNYTTFVLSELVIDKKMKEILMPIMNIDIDIEKIKNEKVRDMINNKIKDKHKNIVSIQVRECNDEILDINDIDKGEVLLIILNALDNIKNKYPKFMHGDLKLENLYAFRSKEYNKNIILNNETYNISSINYEIKIGGFSKSELINNTPNKDFETICNSLKISYEKNLNNVLLNPMVQKYKKSNNNTKEIKRSVRIQKKAENISSTELEEDTNVGDVEEDIVTLDGVHNTITGLRNISRNGNKKNIYKPASYSPTESSIYSGGKLSKNKESEYYIDKYDSHNTRIHKGAGKKKKKTKKNMRDILGNPEETRQEYQKMNEDININKNSKLTKLLGTNNLGNPNLPLTTNNSGDSMPNIEDTKPVIYNGIDYKQFNQGLDGVKMTNFLGDINQEYNTSRQNMNPQMMNPQMMNPQMMNPQMMNPQMMNPQMMNPQMMNPQMMNPQMMNQYNQHQMMMQQMMSNPMAQQYLQNGYNGPVTPEMMQQFGIENMYGGSKQNKKEISNSRTIYKGGNADEIVGSRHINKFFFLNQQKNKVQKGGDGINVTPYDPRFMKNTPFKTQEQKKIEASRYEEKKEAAPILEFKVNENIMYPAKAMMKKPTPPFVTTGPNIYDMYAPNFTQQLASQYPSQYPMAYNPMITRDTRYPYLFDPTQVPIIAMNKYDIKLPGFVGDHANLYKVFEDVLPGDEFSNTYNTLEERRKILYNLRSNLVRHNDGELIGLTGKNKELRNLLSYIHMMELNPYHVEDDYGRNNPYRDLPSNMIMFRSCYPLQIDSSNKLMCNKNSIGMNVRIYEMRVADYFTSELGIDKLNLDLWREIFYYEYVREEILKKKINPNFVMMYSYYLSNAEGLNFNKLRDVRNLNKAPTRLAITGFDEMKKEFETLVKTAVADPRSGINITLPTDKVLVSLTEAPNMPIIKWAMKQYQSEGIVNKMIFTGFHSENEWMSVLFQLLAGMYTMDIHNISMNNFSLRNNVFIKDLKTQGNNIGYWKYIIEDIPYYVPNYGHLLMIDSSYQDLEYMSYRTIDPINKSREVFYKIYSTNIDPSTYDKKQTIKNFLDVINPSNWGIGFINSGGVKPPEKVMQKIEEIYNDALHDMNDPNFTIEKYIKDHFRKYMHNRIGTLLRTNEISNLIKENPQLSECNIGKLFIKEIKADSQYQIVMIYDVDATNNNVGILTKNSIDDINFTREYISINNILKYSPYEHLEQNYKAEEGKLSESDLLDIYMCKKI